jgi:DNA helicase IV
MGCVDVLSRIKRLALARRIVLTRKAEDEMHADNLTEDEVIESIVGAQRIDKVLRSSRRARGAPVERLYVIKGFTFDNVLVYTKGKIVRDADLETFYILISSKQAV